MSAISKGLTQALILIAIIMIVLLASYVGINQYKNYQIQKLEKEELVQEMVKPQEGKKEEEKLEKEEENISQESPELLYAEQVDKWPEWLKEEREKFIEDVQIGEKKTKEMGWKTLYNSELPQFLEWAKEHEINFVGVRDTILNFSINGFDPIRDTISLTAMPGIDFLFKGFKKIPSHLIDLLRGDTIYLSIEYCVNTVGEYKRIFDPSYSDAVKEDIIKIANNQTDLSQLIYVPAGLFSDKQGSFYLEPIVVFLCQPFNESVAVHEVGHAVDLIGICMHKGREFTLGKTDEEIRTLYDEYKQIFEISGELWRAPPGYTVIHGTTNIQENFAVHFEYYVNYPSYFREKAAQEPELAKKYQFLKTRIFFGEEY